MAGLEFGAHHLQDLRPNMVSFGAAISACEKKAPATTCGEGGLCEGGAFGGTPPVGACCVSGLMLTYLLNAQLFNFLGKMGYMSVKDENFPRGFLGLVLGLFWAVARDWVLGVFGGACLTRFLVGGRLPLPK